MTLRDQLDQKLRKRVFGVMQREMICSEHGALCFIEARRRDNARKRRKVKRRG
jgi:hypothetical protein